MSADGIYRREIDGLRALAVIPVVLYHAGFPLFRGGFVGVDVFFVISGYLITGVINSQLRLDAFSLVNFYERRIRRILPALSLVMLACLPFAWIWFFPREMADFSKSIVAVCLFTSNLFFNGAIGYFAPDVDVWPLIHTWSLSVEEQFYVVFPVMLLLTRKWKSGYVFALIAGLSVLSLGLSEWMSRTDPQADFYLPQTRAWELGIGALIALAPRGEWRIGPAGESGLACLGLAMLAYSVFFFDRAMPLPGLQSLAPVGGAALLVAFATSETLCGRLLGRAPFVGVGLISYSAYLWHQPLFAFARFRFSAPPAGAAMLALSAIAFGLAYLSWRFVEQPFRDRRRFSRIAIFGGAFVTLGLFIIVGRTIAIHRGFPNRVPVIVGADDVGAYRNKCIDIPDLRPASLVAMQDCRMGVKTERPDFLLIGDSHAASLADGLNVAASREGRSGIVLASNACMPIVGLDTLYARSDEACRKLHDEMFGIVDKLGIKLVLLHARWEAMDEEISFNDQAASSASVRQGIHDRLVKTLSAFAERGVRVEIITSTPQAPYRVPEILARKARFGLNIDERASFSRFMDENRTAFAMFAEPDIQKYARTLDLYPFFCGVADAEHCAVAEGARPYFFDDSHLSSFASIALAPLLQNLFK